ncbi:hypothetical protein [Xanthomonas sp. 1678]|uniref:hypothetical protein n=1 Tax=Xanthomonas sp. 1678 TaxID=3158788 RepID=UPI0028635C2D|nr:hypothetical protein [Xanthomonas translucens]
MHARFTALGCATGGAADAFEQRRRECLPTSTLLFDHAAMPHAGLPERVSCPLPMLDAQT